MRRLTKSRTNRVMDGVLGGVGEYFNIDPVIVRILYVIFTISTAIGGGIIIYLIAMVIIPEGDSSGRWSERGTASTEAEWSEPSERTNSQHSNTYSNRSRNGGLLIGIIFILVGGIFLLNNILDVNIMYYIRKYGEYFWGIGLVAVGLLLIFMGGRRR